MMGFVEMDVVDLIRQRGKPVRRVSPLSSPDSQDRPGCLEYTVGYYGKLPPNKELSTDGSDPSLPEDLRDKPEFKDARAVALNDLEAAVLVTPPDPDWPSGLLSVQVHEIRDLSVKTMGKERKAPSVISGRRLASSDPASLLLVFSCVQKGWQTHNQALVSFRSIMDAETPLAPSHARPCTATE